ncbi:hypothetical protein IB233_02095 [Comamonas sp. CMM01]|jgi:hypothetical protein|uniref:hypothetical protein n=1 Tax=Comamonas sp. CMM01 TaxID=2769280 RepID=UPI001787480E|nr:hypothetical protein [Comamonas sp. CMM01]MBD9530423.1 hypothetical protein [Comamonas sp. CMM01]
MVDKTQRNEFEYCGYQILAKANAASTRVGAWFPSYQIRDESVNTALPHPNLVNGSDDLDWVLDEAVRLAKLHIDTYRAM